MSKNIEVEIRGPLTKEQFDNLNKFMEKNAKFVNEKDRLSVMYFRDKIPKNSLEIKDDKVDLRVRVTNKKAEIVMKYGSWSGSDARKEFSFNIELNKFEEALEFLKYLGWSICVVYATKAKTYMYKDIEFGIIEVKNVGYVYEAEILTEKQEDVKKAESKIRSVCKDLGLREYKPNEFETQCDKVNNTRGLQFDFSKQDISEVRKRFKEFF